MAKRPYDAIAQIQTLAEGITGINAMPSSVPFVDDSVYPFPVALPGRGKIITEAYGAIKGLHNFTLELHFTPADVKLNIPNVTALIDDVYRTLLDPANITLSNTVDTIIDVNYAYERDLIFAGQQDEGYVFNIQVEIREVL